MGKLFRKDLVASFGLCKFLNSLSVLCFGTNLLGHPLLLLMMEKMKLHPLRMNKRLTKVQTKIAVPFEHIVKDTSRESLGIFFFQ